MPSPQATSALVTSFSSQVIDTFKSIQSLPSNIGYMVGQVEKCPDTGSVHLQAYVQLRRKGTKSVFQSAIGDSVANVQFQKHGSVQAMVNYCQKEESRVEGPWEYGILVTSGSNKRKLREAVEQSPDRMADEDPKVYRRIMARIMQEKYVEKFKFTHDKRPWQIKLEEIISKPADDRQIIWVYGEKGNEGKSTYAKKLYTEGWFYSRGGKVQDILYSYAMKPEAHVVFDIPRSQKDYINYSVIEQLKDGLCTSVKYEPIMISRIEPIHVVVMANFKPNMGEDSAQLSDDRVVLIDCAESNRGPWRKVDGSLKTLEVPASSEVIYMGQVIDPSNVIRGLPNGNHVCYEDEEFQYIWNRANNAIRRVTQSPWIGGEAVLPEALCGTS